MAVKSVLAEILSTHDVAEYSSFLSKYVTSRILPKIDLNYYSTYHRVQNVEVDQVWLDEMLVSEPKDVGVSLMSVIKEIHEVSLYKKGKEGAHYVEIAQD